MSLDPQAIVAEGNECTINGIKVQIKPHTNKDSPRTSSSVAPQETKEEVLTDLFVAWGRQVEKVNPLSEEKIAKYFDTKYKEIAAGWKAAEDERREAEEREKVRAQERVARCRAPLVQEQQRQELVLRQRTEEPGPCGVLSSWGIEGADGTSRRKSKPGSFE